VEMLVYYITFLLSAFWNDRIVRGEHMLPLHNIFSKKNSDHVDFDKNDSFDPIEDEFQKNIFIFGTVIVICRCAVD